MRVNNLKFFFHDDDQRGSHLRLHSKDFALITYTEASV